jgi:arylsulfatase A-like enzyme
MCIRKLEVKADTQRVAALPEILSDAGYETIMSGKTHDTSINMY